MSLIEIPDGKRKPIWFERMEIVAVRQSPNPSEEGKTMIFLKGDDDPWRVECPLDVVLSLIPARN